MNKCKCITFFQGVIKNEDGHPKGWNSKRLFLMPFKNYVGEGPDEPGV
jgi:hypothetical protein